MLQSLSICQSWQKDEPYTGTVKFKNGVKMEFSLMLNTAKCKRIMEILKDELTESAKTLGDMMVKSMPVAISETTETKEAYRD